MAGSGGLTGSGGTVGGMPNGSSCGGDRPCASGSCQESLTAFDGAQTPTWKLNGSAAYDPVTQTVVLAPKGVTYTAGTAIYRDAIVTDAVTLTFDFSLAGSAEGLAFMIETNGSDVVGADGGGFGVAGLNGYCVEHDLWDSANCSGDKDDNHAGIDTLAIPCVTDRNTRPRSRRAPISPSPSATAPGRPRSSPSSAAWPAWRSTASPCPTCKVWRCPASSPGRSTSRLLAANGGLTARQEIRNVQITFPTPRCL